MLCVFGAASSSGEGTHWCASDRIPSPRPGSSCRRDMMQRESSALPAAELSLAALPRVGHCGPQPVGQRGRQPWLCVVATRGEKCAIVSREIGFDFEAIQKKKESEQPGRSCSVSGRVVRDLITSLILRIPGKSNANAGERRRDMPTSNFMCWLSAEHVMFLGAAVQRVPCQPHHANPGSLVVETRAGMIPGITETG